MDVVSLYYQCLDGYGAVTRWPDGRALLDQPLKLIDAFNLIGFEVNRLRKNGGSE